ncbi:MAG: glycine cleavage T C-terminal barrel domain-containing protein [Caldilineaceae bacterium]
MAQTTTINDYDALTTGAALLERPDVGLLVLTDADRNDFLHRMTTNEINKLPVGAATVTVLTNPTARSLFVFTVLARTDALWLLPVSGQTSGLERHLRGQIFFMDKVKVQNGSDQYRRCRLMGPLAERVLANTGFAVATLADDRWLEQDNCIILKQTKFDVPGFEIIAPQEQYATLVTKLVDDGAVLLSDADAYQSYRIELGRPQAGHEVTDAVNPLEAGLAWTCADNKGCYTGQEIIARQITYDKITKSLVGLRSDTLLPVGAELMDESGRAVGAITSAVESRGLGVPLALAIVKRPQNAPGTVLTVDKQRAEVVALPFVEVA